MDTFERIYTHLGVTYVHDAYTNTTMPLTLWVKLRNTGGYIPTEPPKPTVEEIEREKARVEKIKARADDRDALMEKAKELADTIPECTREEIDQWRVARGYLWKAVTPKGVVYTEVIKPLTQKDAADYIEFNALKIAYHRATGMFY